MGITGEKMTLSIIYGRTLGQNDDETGISSPEKTELRIPSSFVSVLVWKAHCQNMLKRFFHLEKKEQREDPE